MSNPRLFSGMRSAWIALAAMAPVYFFSYFHRAAVPGTIFNEIQMDLHLTATAVAGLGALFLGIYAVTQLFIGMAVDRYGGRRMLLAGGLLMAAGSLWFPSSRTVVELYLARALTGFGASFMFLSIVHEIEALFGPRRFPTVLGMVLFMGYAGGMSGTLPFAALTAWLGWRESLFAVALLTVLSILGAWLTLRTLPPSPRTAVRISFRPVLDVLLSRRSLPLMLACMSNFAVLFVVQNVVGKKLLQDTLGLGSNRAATFVLIMAAISAGSAFLCGLWLKWSGQRRRPVLLIFGFILVLGVGVLIAAAAFRAPASLYLAGYILLAASVGSGAAASAVIKELNRPDCVAQSVAVLNASSYVGVSVLSYVSGRILDRFADRSTLTPDGRLYPMEAYLTLFIVMGGIAVFSWICMSRIPETWAAQPRVVHEPAPVLPQPQTEGTPL
jgi:predicted MFS family arabinose efflux permease